MAHGKRKKGPAQGASSSKASKREKKAAKAATTATTSAVSSGSTFKVDGTLLVTVFLLVFGTKDVLKDKWFTADDICKLLPKLDSRLRGHEDKCTPRMFTNALNKRGGDSFVRYGLGNADGVYSNRHIFNVDDGSGKIVQRQKYCYLITQPKTQCPDPPTAFGFTVANIKDLPLMIEATAAATTNNNAATMTTLASPSNNNNNNNGAFVSPSQPPQVKQSDILRQQSYWHSPEAFIMFMPNAHELDMDDYDDIQETVLAEIDNRIDACKKGVHHWIGCYETEKRSNSKGT